MDGGAASRWRRRRWRGRFADEGADGGAGDWPMKTPSPARRVDGGAGESTEAWARVPVRELSTGAVNVGASGRSGLEGARGAGPPAIAY